MKWDLWDSLSPEEKMEVRKQAADRKVQILEERQKREAAGTCGCPDCQGTNE